MSAGLAGRGCGVGAARAQEGKRRSTSIRERAGELSSCTGIATRASSPPAAEPLPSPACGGMRMREGYSLPSSAYVRITPNCGSTLTCGIATDLVHGRGGRREAMDEWRECLFKWSRCFLGSTHRLHHLPPRRSSLSLLAPPTPPPAYLVHSFVRRGPRSARRSRAAVLNCIHGADLQAEEVLVEYLRAMLDFPPRIHVSFSIAVRVSLAARRVLPERNIKFL
ncbi:hypothetical protein B0H16DRAFT_1505668 [Mycena metata]|uniref:Uncharacterized protein n=1 Tax=Mycena metata TaxID=1033252 RepID=A0AAD7K349_9AGAR|nr:hypothetical protein B0H16DRAFT_1608997 [Mycena metata]KAJ7776104.1 hypothetical protein B0H16DRAFT_1505668 [Mycena metata]